MKKCKFLLWMLAIVAGFTFAACSSSDDSVSEGGDNPDEQVPPGPPAPSKFEYAEFMGIVTDGSMPLQGVEVTNGTNKTTTDANGVFTFDKVNVNSGRTVVKFHKTGYVDIVRAMPKVSKDVWTVAMMQENNSGYNMKSSTFDKNYGEVISFNPSGSSSTGMNVALPKGYKTAEGKAYTGTNVTAKAVYLNPDNSDFATRMPGGDLAAVRTDGSNVQLISYGMTSVDLTGDNGEKLQLGDGEKATLTFPIPQSQSDFTPDSIPLWSFNETTGLWEEEGWAYKNGDAYVGTVTHFSWVNLDYPQSRATLKINVVDDNGKKLPYITVSVDDGQRLVYTDENGYAELFVPCDTKFNVSVPSRYFTYLDGETERSVTVNKLTAGQVKEVTLTLPSVAVISGTINNTASGSKICAVKLTLAGHKEVSTVSDLFGQFRMVIPGSYKGVASVTATASDGTDSFVNVTLDGTDKTVNIDIASKPAAKSPGQLVLIDEAGNRAPIDFEPDGTGSVNIIDDELSAQFNSYSNTTRSSQSISFIIEKFAAGTNSYSDIYASFYSSQDVNGNNYAYTNISVTTSTVTLTRTGDDMKFTIKGDATYYGSDTQYAYKKGKVEINITLPVKVEGKCYYNQTEGSVAGIPDFMPYIKGKTFHAMVLSKCEGMGPGAVICYTQTEISDDEYNSLGTQLEQKLGKPITSGSPKGDMQHDMMFGPTFFTGSKYAAVFRNPWYKDRVGDYGKDGTYEFHFRSPDEIIYSPEVHDAHVTVRAFTNVQIPITDLVMSW